ncbi:MAG TPA: endopeptidase La [Gemmatimonadales bacterium]|jgi:ATP-dependent Lon protease|nr:endopeptidase La [Gemmatimonadales bacterium]
MERLPVLPLGQLVVYPHVVLPLALTDPKAVQLIDEIIQGEKRLLLGVVKSMGGMEPPEGAVMNTLPHQLYDVGTLGTIVRMLKLGDGSVRVMVQGLDRARLKDVAQGEKWLMAECEPLQENLLEDARTEALKRTVIAQFSRVIDIAPYLGAELHEVLAGIAEAGKLADFIAANLDLALPAKAELLAIDDVTRRLERLGEFLVQELQVLEVGTQIQEKVKTRLDQNQREYVLREQLQVIRQELGEGEGDDELEELAKRLEEAQLSAEAKKVSDRELKRLRQMSPQSAEYQVARTYLDVFAALPWSRVTQDRLDLKAAREILDRDHYDLKTIKERILEYLAVRTLNPAAKGSILCFVGPPGVGKTSLGQSIAEALGRKFTRVSLGGVRDEAEIRGHRRTYVGAIPGRIIHALQRCETRSPVLMLDEVDKMGADVRGDPTAALLEVLDPAQNSTFVDHYLEVPFDLSAVMFIATANSTMPIPDPLLDRMEQLTLVGYTPAEKLQIAKRYLMPRQLKETGLGKGGGGGGANGERAHVADGALERLIGEYTREAGVRQLEREIQGVLRKAALEVVEGGAKSVRVTTKNLEKYAGQPKVQSEVAGRAPEIGVATGLAWTPVGGDIMFIEAIRMPGKGQITLTGQLGDVMKESAQAAWSLLRARANTLGIPLDAFTQSDVHLHVPAGGVPKDGPSAGITIAAALASLLCRRPARHDVAMTGELTLRGRVLPIGGLKEKLTAAARAGVTSVLVPERNKNDLIDLPEEVQKLLDIKLVETIDDVLELALLDAPAEERRGERLSGGIRVVTTPPASPTPTPPPGQARR